MINSQSFRGGTTEGRSPKTLKVRVKPEFGIIDMQLGRTDFDLGRDRRRREPAAFAADLEQDMIGSQRRLAPTALKNDALCQGHRELLALRTSRAYYGSRT